MPRFAVILVLALLASACSGIWQRWPPALPPSLFAEPHSDHEGETGLPLRAVHRASGVPFVLVLKGEFRMGSSNAGGAGQTDEARQHLRLIRQPFYLSETEVTVAQFRRFVEATGYQTDAERGTPEGTERQGAFATTSQGDRTWAATASWRNPFPLLPEFRIEEKHPVVQVSWNDARSFAAHFGMELPSEAQWEYGVAAGRRDRFPWGDGAAEGRGSVNVLDSSAHRRFSAWNGAFPFDDGYALLAPVGRFRPNWWGLWDMIGNVAEWVADAYGPYPADGADEAPVAGDAEAVRVVRGCSWLDLPFLCRSAARAGLGPAWRRDFVGFRVMMKVEPSE